MPLNSIKSVKLFQLMTSNMVQYSVSRFKISLDWVYIKSKPSLKKQSRGMVVPRLATTLTLKSKVKVRARCQLKGLITRILHAKFQCSIINTSEDMSQVKVFVTDGHSDRQADEF